MRQIELKGRARARRGVHISADRKGKLIGLCSCLLEVNESRALFCFSSLEFVFYNVSLRFLDEVGWVSNFCHAILVQLGKNFALACLYMRLMIYAF